MIWLSNRRIYIPLQSTTADISYQHDPMPDFRIKDNKNMEKITGVFISLKHLVHYRNCYEDVSLQQFGGENHSKE